jgi:hypothetical protein
MSEFIRITVYRTTEGLSCHVAHMLGGYPRPKVVRRREINLKAIAGVPNWATALGWASKVLAQEARRLSVSPPAQPAPPAPPWGGHGGETLNLDLRGEN